MLIKLILGLIIMQDLYERKVLHEVEIEIAKYFIGICEKYGLKYYILGGTLLGAVRHKGFIPWDDDMDFGMPRGDYEKLKKIMQKENSNEYIYKNYTNSDIKTYFSRIESKKVQIIDQSAKKTDYRNAWIDIFPLDGMPNNFLLRIFHKYRLLFLRLLLQYSQFSEIVNINLPNRPWYEKIFVKLGLIIKPEKYLDRNKIMDKLDRNLKKYSYDDSLYVVNFMGAYKFKEMFKKEIYENDKLYDFENIKLNGPKDFDTVLKSLYGDYMTPPKDSEKNKHFTKVVIDKNK